MSRSHHISARGGRRQRFVATVLVAAFALSNLPIPLLQVSADSFSATATPQEAATAPRPCGCKCAVSCGKQCCCSRRGKTPVKSDDVSIEPLRVAKASAALLNDPARAGNTDSPRPAHKQPRTQTASKVNSEPGYLIASLVSHCRGTPWGVSSLPWAVVPPPSDFKLLRQNDEFPAVVNVVLESLAPEPPEPPPRIATVLS